LLFEGGGEGFPLGEEGGALGAEGFEGGGGVLGVNGRGEVAEVFFGGDDPGVEGGELAIDCQDTVFELLELDGVEALDGWFGSCRGGTSQVCEYQTRGIREREGGTSQGRR